jgi:K+-sensing histidine kinase KdpD
VQKDKTEEEEAQNPAFDLWKAQEQQVLSYLLMSVSHDILVHVAALPSAAEVWKNIKTLFASQSRARVINTSMALATRDCPRWTNTSPR